MIIDAWAQHPTLRQLQDPIFASLRRWTKAPAPTAEMPVAQTLAAMDAAGVSRALICAWAAPYRWMITNDEVAGFGPLQRYLDDPDVEELWINEPSRIFVARRGRSELTPLVLTDRDVRHGGAGVVVVLDGGPDTDERVCVAGADGEPPGGDQGAVIGQHGPGAEPAVPAERVRRVDLLAVDPDVRLIPAGYVAVDAAAAGDGERGLAGQPRPGEPPGGRRGHRRPRRP